MYLDDNRLLQEHRCIHNIIQSITAAVNHKIKKFYYCAGYVAYRHYLLASELRIRGMYHESFIDKEYGKIPIRRRTFDYLLTPLMVIKDATELKKRWSAESSNKRPTARVTMRSVPMDMLEGLEKLKRNGLPKDVFLV